MKMKRRTRTLAGALALAAMALSYGETVLASTCAPMADMAPVGEMAGMPEMASMDAVPMDGHEEGGSPSPLDCPLIGAHPGDREDASDRSQHCPLSPAVGPSCSAAAYLPVPPELADPHPDHAARASLSHDALPDLFLSHALFHPPRA